MAVAFTVPITFVTDHEVPANETLNKAKGNRVTYVVDGKKITEEELKNLDVNHIARVSASKDKKDIEKYVPGDDDGVIFINTYQKKVKGSVPEKPRLPEK